ncbi:MAG: tRNA (adenosine(37)-N6)-threonylcarbamoyltransferase complex ATPase subunit type 1 TsaE [Sedimentisphaerales bacterium]|nr:tRNA (adenosine(37)-N6)-threonylcarbamoyltransferase complex ATPase subunit type 1 TsaE [Sedimentisphaerales bacterium]
MAKFISDSPQQTIEIGRKIGAALKGGEVICLIGPLGAGKTHLVKGIAAGVGAQNAERVNSPTFVIVNEYFGRLELYHIDAYRIEKPSDFEMLGFDDFLHPGAVVIIEWANKVHEVLKNISCIEIEMTHEGQTERGITVINLIFNIEY